MSFNLNIPVTQGALTQAAPADPMAQYKPVGLALESVNGGWGGSGQNGWGGNYQNAVNAAATPISMVNGKVFYSNPASQIFSGNNRRESEIYQGWGTNQPWIDKNTTPTTYNGVQGFTIDPSLINDPNFAVQNLGSYRDNSNKNGSLFTQLRDGLEAAGSVVGNYFLPGSGLVTAPLTSKGSQDYLNSSLGRVAMIGSGVAGGVNGNLGNYGKIADSLSGATAATAAPGISPSTLSQFYGSAPTELASPTELGMSGIGSSASSGALSPSYLQSLGITPMGIDGGLSPLASQSISNGLAPLTDTGSGWTSAMGNVGAGSAASPTSWGVPPPAQASPVNGLTSDIRGQFGLDSAAGGPSVAAYQNPASLSSFLGNGALSKIINGNASAGDYLRTLSSLQSLMAGLDSKSATRSALGSTSALSQPSQISYAGPGLSTPSTTTFAAPMSIADATQGSLNMKEGGLATALYATGGATRGAHVGPVAGKGGGQDDLIPARLADGEYVFDADVVSALGDGSNKEGARKLDDFRQKLREHKRSASNSTIPPKAKSINSYLGSK